MKYFLLIDKKLYMYNKTSVLFRHRFDFMVSYNKILK